MEGGGLPCAWDACSMTVLVRPLHSRVTASFNRIVDRLNRQRLLVVSDNPTRTIRAHFTTALNAELCKFTELQMHRRALALIAVAFPQSTATTSAGVGGVASRHSSFQSDDGSPFRGTTASMSEEDIVEQLEELNIHFKTLKEEYSSMILDSRCVLIGFPVEYVSKVFMSRETLAFPSLDDSNGLESGIRDVLRAVYTVVESKRVDGNHTCGKVIDASTPCPMLTEEEKFRAGIDNRDSKAYKKKVLGRMRKQLGDLSLLSGLPHEALQTYALAIDNLKSANDLLWLAGAYEGWSCAGVCIRYGIEGNEGGGVDGAEGREGLHRVASMTPSDMKEHAGRMAEGEGEAAGAGTRDKRKFSTNLSTGAHLGHHRWRSDETANVTVNGGGEIMGRGGKEKKTLTWLRREERVCDVRAEEIVEKVELALDNYAKFSFAAHVEYECMMKGVEVFRRERMLIRMEQMHRDRVGKFLDDSFTKFDHVTKASVCFHSASLFKQIDFHRKHAFFCRLGVLFRLHMDESKSRSVHDYRTVFPILYSTLPGYGIPAREEGSGFSYARSDVGPVALQIKAVHEVFTCAMRAQYVEAAIRLCCYLLQVYYTHMDEAMTTRLFGDLANLVTNRNSSTTGSSSMHNLSQLISLESGPILPPLHMTRFPLITKASVCVLPCHLAPTVIESSSGNDVFIYCAFGKKEDAAASWVVDCASAISVHVQNSSPQELHVEEMVLMTEGCSFEAVPIKLTLAPKGSGEEVRLIGVPRSAGRLSITGYSCVVFGVRNVCRLQGPNGKNLTVDVLPSLPLINFECSLRRALIDNDTEEESVAEMSVYSGQTFMHDLTLVNTHPSMAVNNVTLTVKQPKVTGGAPLVELLPMEEENGVEESEGRDEDSMGREEEEGHSIRPFTLLPRQKKTMTMRIFGIDPSATAREDGGGGGENSEEEERKRRNVQTMGDSESMRSSSDAASQHDLIPYTGRLLEAQFEFTYEADMEGEKGEKYERRARFRILISIIPAVVVSSWSVLPGDGPFSRYIVVDVVNSSDEDAELVYSGGKSITVQRRETCRVPLLCDCCVEMGGRSVHEATLPPSRTLQEKRVKRLRRRLEQHIATNVDIRWNIPAVHLEGVVPVGTLLSSLALLKQLVLPAISLSLRVGSSLTVRDEDVSLFIGQIIPIHVDVFSSLNYAYEGELSLSCTQEWSSSHPPIDRSAALTMCTARILPFTTPPTVPSSTSLSSGHSPPQTTVTFQCAFRAEGQYRVVARLSPSSQQRESGNAMQAPLHDDEIFATPITFNIATKGVR